MKNILITAIFFFSASTIFALDYETVEGASNITPRLLRQYLRKGKGTFEGSKILYSKNATVPSKFQKTWNEKKLSGETVPEQGEAGPGVIFIKKFK